MSASVAAMKRVVERNLHCGLYEPKLHTPGVDYLSADKASA